MINQNPVVITKSRSRSEKKDFLFKIEQIRKTKSDIINKFRNNAWEIYSNMNLPTTKDEPWRRTDLKAHENW